MTQIFTGSGLGIQGSSLGLGNYGPIGSAALGQGGESVYINAANGNMVIRQSDGFLADAGFGLNVLQTYNSRGDGGSNWFFNVQSRLEISGEINKAGSSITRIGGDGHKSRFIFDAQQQTYLPVEGGTLRLTYKQNAWIFQEGNEKTSSLYNKQGQLTAIRDADGHCFNFNYQNGKLTNITSSSGKQQIIWRFENDQLTDVTTYSEGAIVHHLHYEYDAHNRLHKVCRDLGADKRFWITYDYAGDSNKISDIKQSDGNTLHIDYDAQGRVKQLIDGEGRLTTYIYESGKTTLKNGLGESWTYYYDESNRLTGIDGPEQYRIRYEYKGLYLSRIVQGQQVWNITYNEAGDCTRIEEPSGQISEKIYDSEHRLLQETHYQSFDGEHHPAHPQTTRYLYDERGHLRFTIAPDGSVTEKRYNEAGQVINARCYLHGTIDVSEHELLTMDRLTAWVTQQNPQAVRLIAYCYDWRGQLTREIAYANVDEAGVGLDKQAVITATVYDAAGRLIEKSAWTDAGWCVTQYFYDDLGRITQTMDNQKRSQRFEYDDAHQRIIQTDANGLQTIKIYDRSGLLVAEQHLDARHDFGTTRYQYDAAGHLIAETGVDGLTTFTFYDPLGRIQARVSLGGQVTEYVYSEAGFVIETLQYQQTVSTQNWLNAFPDYQSIRPPLSNKDRVSQYLYNQYNQLAYSIDAQGGVIAYEYDANGQVLCATAYANRLAHFDPHRLLSSTNLALIKSLNDRSTHYYYDVMGRLQAKINAEGYAVEYQYDRLGNLIHSRHYLNAAPQSLTGDWLHDKPDISAKRDLNQYYLYDARGFKIAEVDPEGYVIEYRYDDGGLLIERCAYEKRMNKGVPIDGNTSLDSIRPESGMNDHRTSYRYNDLGLLIEERTPNGLITTYVYDAVNQLISKTLTDAKTLQSRQELYRYDAMGRVVQSLNAQGASLLKKMDLSEADIELIWLNHSTHYEYNQSGLLIAQTNALHQTTRFFYNDYRQLQYTVNADGAVVETRYNAFGQVASKKAFAAYLGLNVRDVNTEQLSHYLRLIEDERFDEITRYEYNTLGQIIAQYTGRQGELITVFNAFGEVESSTQRLYKNQIKTQEFTYDKLGALTKSIDDIHGLAKQNSFQYDAFGRLYKTTDARDKTLTYSFNKRGEVLLVTNENEKSKSISYDAFGRVLTETDFTHTVVVNTYKYDDVNHTLTLEHPTINTQVRTQFNAFGDTVTIQDANGKTTEFKYNEEGKLSEINSPDKSFKQYRYTDSGLLEWELGQDGTSVHYAYDAAGHILSKTIDPDGLQITTCYTYDAVGRQISITDANLHTKEFTYDSEGHLIQSCMDKDGLHLISHFYYDDRGLLIRQVEVNPQGKDKITAYEWDALGRKTAVIIDPDGLNMRTTYAYDANDNLTCLTDANGHSSHYIYDVLNQCRYFIDARGVVTEHIYTINGQETQTIRYAQAIGGIECYDEAHVKAVIREDAIRDQYQFKRYDNTGRLLYFYDSLGFATRYDYDGNGNVVEKCQYAYAVSLEALKQGKSPTASTNEARYQHFAYDAMNRLRFKCDINQSLTAYNYDAGGHLKSSTQYATRLSLGSSDYSLETISAHVITNAALDNTNTYAYDKAGRLIKELNAKGCGKTYQYDALGNLLSTTQYAKKIPLSGLESLDDISFLPSVNDRTQHYVYDAAGRELYRISSEGRVIERRYDAVGNVTEQVTHGRLLQLPHYNESTISTALALAEKSARVLSYDYDAAGRLLSQTNDADEVTQYTYDAQGNVLTKTLANKALWQYEYDAANQLIKTTSPAMWVNTEKGKEWRSLITLNDYDSFGNLSKEVRDLDGLEQTRLYEYDTNNHRIKTIYPDVAINNANACASSQRQEITRTLIEELHYNAFNEIVASSDKAGNWSHFVYDDEGHLIYSVDKRGALTQYSYDAFNQVVAKTGYAEILRINQETQYTIESITTARRINKQDRHETYVYDASNQLIETRRDAVRMYNATTKHYDANVNPSTVIEYNSFGEPIRTSIRVNEQTWAQSYIYYDNDGHKTATIDAAGYLTCFTNNAFGEVDSMIEYEKPASHWDLETYNQNVMSSKDRKVAYTYDALGRLSSKTLEQVSYQRLRQDGKGYDSVIGNLTSHYLYDALGNLTSSTDAQGNTAYFYYNALGQLIAKVAPKTQAGHAATTYAYDALGHLVETTQWAEGVSVADKEHFVLKGASLKDITNTQTFDNLGQLIAQTDGLGHRTQYSYDANGNLTRSWKILTQVDKTTQIQDKRYTYDSENRILQTATYKNTGGIKTEDVQYNAFGEIMAKGIDGQFNQHVDYDQLGRIWRTNSQGYYQIYLYDLAGNLTQLVTSTNNYTLEQGEGGVDLSTDYYDDLLRFDVGASQYDLQRQYNEYDAAGHLLSQTKEFTVYSHTQSNTPYLESIKQSQMCDRWGNMLSYTSGKGNVTLYEYNVFNQLIRQEFPEVKSVDEHGVAQLIKPTTTYFYDSLGQAIAMTDANGHTVGKQYDAMGRITQETDAKGNVRTKYYNLLDQLEYLTDERGNLTRYTYDKKNRLLFIKSPKTSQGYEYDEDGQLIKQTNGAGEETRFFYDSLGNQRLRKGLGREQMVYEYDDWGRKTKETDSLGRSQHWKYNEDGRLYQHVDLGGHLTTYTYNSNGFLLHESSTAGKDIDYHYQADGQLVQYSDNSRCEVVNFTFDADGLMTSKESSAGGDYREGWIRETDYYQYDAQGRLVQVRRRNPDVKDSHYPNEEQTRLSIDYDYDAVGNIRHTKVIANYANKQQITNEDYFTYDENNRMLINKGQLVNGTIDITKNQGSQLLYDSTGNITDAFKYENNALQSYHYLFNEGNQLEMVQKNGHKIQVKSYDDAGRVSEERLFNAYDNIAQINIMHYLNGQLSVQQSLNAQRAELSNTQYDYDDAGNLHATKTHEKKHAMTTTHTYEYALWDTYQQSSDYAEMSVDNRPKTHGKSTRIYDKNGNLQDAIDAESDDSGISNTTHYWYSSLEGIKAKIGKEGQTSYLSVAGKTIGDFTLGFGGKQQLNVYGGFTPTGSQQKYDLESNPLDALMWVNKGGMRSFSSFLRRAPGDIADGTLPELPSNNFGVYTIQAGDTLEGIALAVYGDSSLWYLLADANGITEKKAEGGNSGQLQIGQRLNIPSVTVNQHHTNNTHKVVSTDERIGNTSATIPIPLAPPPIPRKHQSLLSNAVVAIVCTVATVLTAGILGTVLVSGSIASLGFGSLFKIGLGVLGHGMLDTMGLSLAAGFTAGFVGNIAGQGAALALRVQDNLDFKGALISGLTTALTSGFAKGIGSNTSLSNKLEDLSINKVFNIKSAAEMMEQNTATQGINIALNRQHHFEWDNLATTGLTAGILGSKIGSSLNETLKTADHKTGFLSSQLEALLSSALQTATGSHFDATQVLSNNLGNSLASSLIETTKETETNTQASENLLNEDLSLNLNYDPIPPPETQTPIPKEAYQNLKISLAKSQLAERELENDTAGLTGLDDFCNPNKSKNKKNCSKKKFLCWVKASEISEEKLLAGISYGESSTRNDYKEMAAIASATLRKRDAEKAGSVYDLVEKNKNFIYVIGDGNTRFRELMCAKKPKGFDLAFKAARNALSGGKDFSNGGCFWDGYDLKTKGVGHYKYKTSFKFTTPSHNIFSVKEPPPLKIRTPKGVYNTVYESTATHGRTIFWKLNKDFLKLTGAKQCI